VVDDNDEIDTFTGPEPKSSAGILAALKKSDDKFRNWQATCQDIDEIYSREGTGFNRIFDNAMFSYSWADSQLDLFWASYEILKPATYARPPVPAVAPLFQDNKPLQTTTAELLERTSVSVFKRTCIDDVMKAVRDDLLFTNRGVMWLRYETDDGKKVCVEHVDRTDFRHEPARYWSEVGWVAKRSWMTRKEMRKRFHKTSGDAYQDVKLEARRDENDTRPDSVRKGGVWEVWHRADNKVYWVAEGCDKRLDEDKPHLKLDGFFPCPRPAYGTLQRRSLIPVPDWERYAVHFQKISTLTSRIYLLLEKVRMKGLIAAGGDIGDAVEELIRSDDDEILIPVPGAAMMATGGAANIVSWLPLNELAQAIQGLIDARTQLINDFYQLSGISDIMRGATEAEETLGAQQLKSQFGSVRVQEKIDELQRIAADAVKIAAEIIAENFDKDTLLEMSQMEIPTKADIEKRIKEIEKAAKEELSALKKKAEEMAAQVQMQPAPNPSAQMAPQGPEQPQIDPQQAQQQFEQAQQAIVQKYAQMLNHEQQQVPIEDVMKLLRDDRARNFAFEIESDSTILTDELQEKASRNEFLQEFTNASQGLMGIAAMGEQGAKLAGELMKFVLAPYRAGRTLNASIDEFIDAAPEMAAKAQGAQGDDQGLAEANKMLAEAEMTKAKAAVAGVQAKSQLDQAENQRKMGELQLKAQADAQKAQSENQKLQLQIADMQEKAAQAAAMTEAQINKLTADTAKILASIGLDERKQQLSEYAAANQAQAQQVDQALAVEGQQQDAQFREREHERADRGEDRADRGQEFTEQSSDRQMTLAERQAQQGQD